MRVKLKSSKSYPNDKGRDQLDQKPTTNQLTVQQTKNEECDNSSSGVSSDQEITISHMTQHKTHGILKNATEDCRIRDIESPTPITNIVPMETPLQSIKVIDALNKKSMKLPPLSNVTKKILNVSNDPHDKSQQQQHQQQHQQPQQQQQNDREFYDDDATNSPSPPSKGFQRNNSLTRKQAAAIAMNRALNSRPAVSLVQLPPPIEGDSDNEQQATVLPPQLLGRVPNHHSSSRNKQNYQNQQQSDYNRTTIKTNFVVPPPLAYDKSMSDCSPSQENIVLAPPPQFCDCTNANITKIMNNNNAAGLIAENNGMSSNDGTNNTRGVRIVGAVPKISRLHSH